MPVLSLKYKPNFEKITPETLPLSSTNFCTHPITYTQSTSQYSKLNSYLYRNTIFGKERVDIWRRFLIVVLYYRHSYIPSFPSNTFPSFCNCFCFIHCKVTHITITLCYAYNTGQGGKTCAARMALNKAQKIGSPGHVLHLNRFGFMIAINVVANCTQDV